MTGPARDHHLPRFDGGIVLVPGPFCVAVAGWGPLCALSSVAVSATVTGAADVSTSPGSVEAVVDCSFWTGSSFAFSVALGIRSLSLPLPFSLLTDLGKVGAGEFHFIHDELDFGLSRCADAVCAGCSSVGLLIGEATNGSRGEDGPATGASGLSSSPASSGTLDALTPLCVLLLRTVAELPRRLRSPIARPPASPSSCLASASSDVGPLVDPDDSCEAKMREREAAEGEGIRPDGTRREDGGRRG